MIPWAAIEPPVLLRLCAEVAAVRGGKQSGGDRHTVADLRAAVDGEHAILPAVGDLVLPFFVLGARAAVAAMRTAAPALVVALGDVVRGGRIEEALRLHAALLPVWRALEGPNMPARRKAARALQSAVTAERRERLRVGVGDAALLGPPARAGG